MNKQCTSYDHQQLLSENDRLRNETLFLIEKLEAAHKTIKLLIEDKKDLRNLLEEQNKEIK